MNLLSESDVESDKLEGLLVQLQAKDEQLKFIDIKIENVLDMVDIDSLGVELDTYSVILSAISLNRFPCDIKLE
ncbi:hypothetical protein NPIL_231551 [Nephila pilipes]|uniref:Uncharacterized protein n=1 Tax=Nephila pilipes TaxID=299642 RepID=A0A8X6QGX5_NEPPI|nr:hypothetical protein NPIL_231551 [Nephila pilipes]